MMATTFPALRNWRRRLFIGVAVAVTGVALVGCTPEAQIFARLKDGKAQVVVCDRIEATAIEAEAASGAEGQDYLAFWSASGARVQLQGRSVELGISPRGMSTDEFHDVFRPTRDRLRISISGYANGKSIVEVAVFPQKSLSGDHWRSQSGTVRGTDSPCK